MVNKMNNKHKLLVASLALAVIMLLPAILFSAGNKTGGNTTFSTGTLAQPSSSTNRFYAAIGTSSGGINITINSTNNDRLNRDIKLTVNATKMLTINGGPAQWPAVIQCDFNITYPNGTSRIFSVSTPETPQIFSLKWRAETSLPTGTYQVRAYPWNATHAFTNFNFSPVSVFELYNTDPVGSVALERDILYRNEEQAFFISIFDPETPFSQLAWNVSLYRVQNNSIIKTWYKSDTLNQTYRFNKSSDVLGWYNFFIKIRDADGGLFNYSVSPFQVLNNPPKVNSVTYNYTANLKRETEVMEFTVNVTDSDNPWNGAEVRILLNHESTVPGSAIANLSSAPLKANDTTKLFTGTLNVSRNFITGPANIIIMAQDNDTLNPAITYYHPLTNNVTTVMNNLPELHDVQVNNKSIATGLSFSQNVVLEFFVNATDLETPIDYIAVSLEYKDNPAIPRVQYFMFSGNATVLIPTAVLLTGSWEVFVNVVDFDGGLIIQSRGTIEINPDLRDQSALVIGAILVLLAGFVLGGIVIWRYANTRISAVRRDLIIKGKSKDATATKKVQPGEKTTTSKYTELPTKVPEKEIKPQPKPVEKSIKPQPKPVEKTTSTAPGKPITSPASKPADKAVEKKPFTGAKAPPLKKDK
jgi:hypothetical protein